MTTPILKVENLVKKVGFWYPKKLVNGISFEIQAGEIVALMGGNGAGKSTVLDMLSGLSKPTEGRIFLYQDEKKIWEDITAEPLYKRAQKGLSYLPQTPSLFTKLTVRQNLLGMLELMSKEDLQTNMEAYNSSLKNPKDFCDSLLERFGLLELANNKSASLSGGQKRRLAIVRALIRKTKLLILDEPFNELDQEGIKLCREIFRHISKEGITILVVLHRQEDIQDICDRVIFMDKGKICGDGSPEKKDKK